MRKIVLIVLSSILKSLKLIGKNEKGFHFRFLVFYLIQSSSNHLLIVFEFSVKSIFASTTKKFSLNFSES